MIRKFKFEAEIYESLNCLPMAARRKLDAVGIKLHLAQWEQLGRGERLMICHAPADSEEEQSALRTFIEEVALARTGSPAKTLSDNTRRSANPPDRPPQILAHQFAAGEPPRLHGVVDLRDGRLFHLERRGLLRVQDGGSENSKGERAEHLLIV